MIPDEILNKYRLAVREYEERDTRILSERLEEAWRLAHQAATLLREKYNVTRIVVFGSLVKRELFTHWSDVDIAVWGLAPEHTFIAIADMLWFVTEIEVNLVDVNTCSSSLLAAIEREGVDI
jgi:uncharacterized protein